MAAITTVPQTIHYKGEFDYQAFYSLMKEHFASRDFDLIETRYKDKGDEFEVEWEADREYDALHKVDVEVKYHAWDVQRIRVERSGKPVTLIRARIQVKIVAKVIRGYDDHLGTGVFKEDKFDSFLKRMYDKIADREVDEYWEGEVAGPLVMGLSGKLQSFFGMQNG